MEVVAGAATEPQVLACRARVETREAALDHWVWEGGEVLVGPGGAVALRHNDLHPGRCTVAVAPAAAPTAAALGPLVAAARVAAGIPLRLRTWDVRLEAAAVALGGRRLVASHLVRAAGPFDGAPVTVTERAVDDPLVGRTMWRLYRRIHGWDPVDPAADLPPSLVADLVAAGTVDVDGRAVAVCAAHAGDPAEAALVGFVEPTDDEEGRTLGLLAWLVERVGPLEVEADSGEGAHPALVAALRRIPGAVWADPLVILEV